MVAEPFLFIRILENASHLTDSLFAEYRITQQQQQQVGAGLSLRMIFQNIINNLNVYPCMYICTLYYIIRPFLSCEIDKTLL